MGRATRWLKGLFGIKSTKENDDRREYSDHGKSKNRWCSGHNQTTLIPANITPAEAAWLRSFYSEPDNEQNRRARAVAAATAAAADAAVAAAQAAFAVVRLTSQGRSAVRSFGGGHEKWAAAAAAKIQRMFRGYLARKAFRALKGLVKIQALVRGFLVRKQAAATLLSMQALIRAQASVRARKNRLRLINNEEIFPPPFQARKSLEKIDEDPTTSSLLDSRRISPSFAAARIAFHDSPKTVEDSPKIVEVDTGCWPKSRSKRATTWISEYSGDDSPAKAISSPFPFRMSTPESPNLECHFSTAQSTPRFAGSIDRAATPAKSVCTESYVLQQRHIYKADTRSLKAKQRSQSAPKLRPEPGPNRILPSRENEMMESRNSPSWVRTGRSVSKAREAIDFKNAVVGKLGRSFSFVREGDF